MTDFDLRNSLFSQFDTLLDEERAALLSGEFDRLSDLLPKKEHLIETLSGNASNADGDLSPLQEKLARNQTLLQSAMEGIRAVADRMAELRRVRHGLQTYGNSGERSDVAVNVRRVLEKRA